jgi:hypothetical protein
MHAGCPESGHWTKTARSTHGHVPTAGGVGAPRWHKTQVPHPECHSSTRTTLWGCRRPDGWSAPSLDELRGPSRSTHLLVVRRHETQHHHSDHEERHDDRAQVPTGSSRVVDQERQGHGEDRAVPPAMTSGSTSLKPYSPQLRHDHSAKALQTFGRDG